MTRDAHRVAEDYDAKDEVFSALWTAASSFPQLPPDASPELRRLTIDVEEPSKVYSIYRASRRHGFQLLVERYVNQLRFGCQDPRCTSPTCFTCRRRLAGATPLRRYNATSARTLACYLASQDNPEKGLCPYGELSQSKSGPRGHMRAPSKGAESAGGVKNVQWVGQGPKGASRVSGSEVDSGLPSPTIGSKFLRPKRHPPLEIIPGGAESQHISTDKEPIGSAAQILKEPVKKDHKSFVQNLLGTVAFRMLEWLTPKNLDAMVVSIIDASTASEDGSSVEYKEIGPIEHQEPSLRNSPSLTGPKKSIPANGSSSSLSHPNTNPGLCSSSGLNAPREPNGEGTENDIHTIKTAATHNPSSTPHNKPEARGSLNHIAQLPSVRHMNGSATREFRERGSVDLGIPKSGHVSGQILPTDDGDFSKSVSAESQHILLGKKPRKRIASVTKPRCLPERDEPLAYDNGPRSPVIRDPRRPSITMTSSGDDTSKSKSGSQPASDQLGYPHAKSNAKIKPLPLPRPLPQSLRIFSIEAIQDLCKMFWGFRYRDGGLDFTYPLAQHCRAAGYSVTENPRAQDKIESLEQIAFQPASIAEPRWRAFIEQSIFYVLSSPNCLLRSFSNENLTLIDTQTIHTCMMHLTRMNSALVFDSLWMAAAELYVPPRELWPIYSYARAHPVSEGENGISLTTGEVARLMSIGLHALIAAVPCVQLSSQLYSISRARSYGLSAVRENKDSPETADLCLTIDDIYSDELALRLARRIFAAIPARRQYQDLLKLEELRNSNSSPTPDILDQILEPLNLLDAEFTSVPELRTNDRSLQRKVAPVLLIDWARTIMLQDWDGRAEVPAEGSFGGALAMISAIYGKRKSLLLSDVQFQTEYFADRLDSMEMPVEWLSFTPNKKTIHLLDHPYLFSPGNLVTYFRAINFSRMSRSFEASNTMVGRIHLTMSPVTLMTDAGRRDDLFNRLRTAVSKFLVLQIRRDKVLIDAFDYLWRREQRELSRPLKIRLGEDSGEEGSDSGGVQQEFFRLAVAEALDPNYGAFSIDERTRMAWFQPSSPEPLWKFELIGLIISLAVYNGLTLPVTFPKALYRKLLGYAVTELHHIEDGWPELASGLTILLEWNEKDGSVSDIFSRTYEFSVESFGQQISRDMASSTQWPQFGDSAADSNPVDARLVDGQNRNEYISDYILWLTDISIRPQFEAFQRGFLTCLDKRSLSLFDPDTLQSIVEGVQEIDISELRRFTRYVGWDASHRTVKDFWSIVKKFGTDEKKKLLEFVTASDRVPVGGMRNLQFVIQRNGVGDIDGHLPTSYTCYGTLLLPEYSSKEILREKVTMALENAKGFGFA